MTITIGYSALIFEEDGYLYNENACYLAESSAVAKQFMSDCGFIDSDFKIVEISLNDLVNDFGCSCGEYAMEKLAYEKFKVIANENGIKHKVEPYEDDPTLMVVKMGLKLWLKRRKPNNLYIAFGLRVVVVSWEFGQLMP